MTANTLDEPKAVPNRHQTVTTPRLFACFERFELSFFVGETSSFSETAQSITRKWEPVDAAWFSTVRGIIERSMAAPKSLEKLSGVIDMYDRARAAVSEFCHTGAGGVRGGACGDLAALWGGSEADLREVRETEARVRQWRESRELATGFPVDPWTAAEREERKAGREPSATVGPANRDSGDLAKKIPAVGSVVNLESRLESFAGVIPPGPATVTAAGVDDMGNVIVSLARGGLTVATGVIWPVQK